jgi:hypothetical protein
MTRYPIRCRMGESDERGHDALGPMTVIRLPVGFSINSRGVIVISLPPSDLLVGCE